MPSLKAFANINTKMAPPRGKWQLKNKVCYAKIKAIASLTNYTEKSSKGAFF